MTTMRKRASALKARGFTTMGRRRHEDARFYGGYRWSKREAKTFAERQPLIFNMIACSASGSEAKGKTK